MIPRAQHPWFVPLLLCLGFLGSVAQANAMSTCVITGDTWVRWVRGAVLLQDYSGDRPPIPGATATLSRGNWSRSVITDEDGYFAFPELPPGNYDLLVELEGFVSIEALIKVRSNIEAGRALVVDLEPAYEYCGSIKQRPWREVRDLQLGKIK